MRHESPQRPHSAKRLPETTAAMRLEQELDQMRCDATDFKGANSCKPLKWDATDFKGDNSYIPVKRENSSFIYFFLNCTILLQITCTCISKLIIIFIPCILNILCFYIQNFLLHWWYGFIWKIYKWNGYHLTLLPTKSLRPNKRHQKGGVLDQFQCIWL